jgi:hypothetical protein
VGIGASFDWTAIWATGICAICCVTDCAAAILIADAACGGACMETVGVTLGAIGSVAGVETFSANALSDDFATGLATVVFATGVSEEAIARLLTGIVCALGAGVAEVFDRIFGCGAEWGVNSDANWLAGFAGATVAGCVVAEKRDWSSGVRICWRCMSSLV